MKHALRGVDDPSLSQYSLRAKSPALEGGFRKTNRSELFANFNDQKLVVRIELASIFFFFSSTQFARSLNLFRAF